MLNSVEASWSAFGVDERLHKLAPEKLQSVIQALLPYLNQSLRSYFSQQPAYVLREDASTGEALAKKYAKGIEVKPGEIVIPFTN